MSRYSDCWIQDVIILRLLNAGCKHHQLRGDDGLPIWTLYLAYCCESVNVCWIRCFLVDIARRDCCLDPVTVPWMGWYIGTIICLDSVEKTKQCNARLQGECLLIEWRLVLWINECVLAQGWLGAFYCGDCKARLLPGSRAHRPKHMCRLQREKQAMQRKITRRGDSTILIEWSGCTRRIYNRFGWLGTKQSGCMQLLQLYSAYK